MRVNFNLDLYRSKVEENRSSAKFVQFLEPSPPSRRRSIYISVTRVRVIKERLKE